MIESCNMKNLTKFWSEENQINLPVNAEENLLGFLSPTAPGSNYWDSPNEVLDKLTEREYKRIIGQAIEIKNIISPDNQFTEKKSLLDVGTGNGLVPKLLGYILPSLDCVGIDPFLHGGHKTSWQKSNLEKDIELIIKLYNDNYGFSKIDKFSEKAKYREYKLFLKEYIEQKNFTKSDFVYCKAIEHVPDWKSFAKELAYTVKENGKLIIKHRSFYSYLGPHRYATSSIPWGHCILNDKEYSQYIDYFHKERAEEMKNFFFNNLSNPRMTTLELIEILREEGMILSSILYSRPKYYKKQEDVFRIYPELVDIALKKNKNLSYEELTSGLIIYEFEKN